MKAVIMAGGEGRRLRPLTADMPKPMLKLCGKPVLEYILKLLEKHGVNEAWLTLGYQSEKIIEHFKNGTFAGIKLNFIVEKTPLGTAGGVRSAVGDIDEEFIVISGDALCDIDLTTAIAYHREKGADATIITRRVSDPREYGLADIGTDGQVRGFLEKPGWSDAFTDMANTGIYILSGLCCKSIKAGIFSDFSRDVFPSLVTKNSLYAYRSDGYWRDIGDITSFVEAQRDLINGKVECEVEGERIAGCIYSEGKPKGNFSIDAPCYIGRGARIGDGAVIGENSIIGDNVIIGAHARTSGCVMMDGAVIGENSLSRGCVVCDGGGIGRNATAANGSVIGPRSLLGDDAVLGEGVVLQEFEVVPDETIMVETPEKTAPQLPEIGDNVIAGRLGTVITPQFCLRLGQALVTACGDRPVCVADDGLNASYIHKQALTAGILAEGGQVYDTGVMFAGQLSFAVTESGAAMGILVGGYGQGIKFVGATIPNSLQKQIEPLISRNAAPTKGGIVRLPEIMSGVSALWENRLISSLPNRVIDFSGSFFCKNSVVAETAAKIFMQLGGKSGGDTSFNFTADGTESNISRAVKLF
ncbi:MAG TPA: sugar phosphate nucleotidyltransferase [Oscillospiraceae bacterium]|nr:sugar phosphate nucleotidyltransferase [Oscillospiraceae bacterium]HPS33732.1 sugar phosphate nucleotidyltransferase [Oscillospiraceae bacterium]